MVKTLPKNLPAFIYHFLRPYSFVAIIYITLPLLAGLWGPLNNLIIKDIIDTLPNIKDKNLAFLVWPSILIVLNFIVFDNITWRSVDYLNYKYQADIKNNIIKSCFDHILEQSHQFFLDNLSGKISSQIITLADNIETIIHRISVDLIRGLSVLIISFALSFTVNPIFCYILILWFIAFSVISLLISRKLIKFGDQHAHKESIVSGEIVDVIANNSNVRIFVNKFFELSRIEKFLKASKKAFQAKELYILILCSVQGGLISILIGFSVYFLNYFYIKNMITIGDFSLILGLSIPLGHMMWYTMARFDDFNVAYGKCKQSFVSIISLANTAIDANKYNNLEINKAVIKFNKVQFNYLGSEVLFNNKSIVIKENQKVGLVGYSGSGKTTFVNLILRLYEISEGNIFIDNQDISKVNIFSLRKSIAMIPQDPILFHRSLMENIRYGNINASNADVIEAAKAAKIHEYISKLPEGYNTLVGERGVKLSGGQRQRIAIARAVLKDAPILILDEATSQLDSVTEKEIQKTLQNIMRNKTTIVIAHRLSTLRNMDRILVFDQGKIIEDGSHEELIKKQGLYETLWKAQIGGFLGDRKSESF